MKRKIILFAFAILLAVNLMAAGTGQDQSQRQAPNTAITITDIAGRTVTLSKPAARIVGTHNPTLNIAVILGGGGKYIAGFGNKNMAGGLYGYVFPELGPLPQVGMGRDVNLESCLLVGADLAILPERFADLAPQFEAVGIPAAVILPNAESFDTIKNSISLLGKLLGEDSRAAEINAFFDRKINTARGIAAGASYHPKVLFTGGSSMLTAANGLMLQSVICETAGAVNVARDAPGAASFVSVSIEEIIRWDPEFIFIPSYAQHTVNDILANPAWGSIRAVREGKVHVFPGSLEPWDYPTPSTAIGLTWLLNTLYPDLYSIDQVVADAVEYYELVYGRSFNAAQLGL